MDNSNPEKPKYNIDGEIIKKFSFQTLLDDGFIPINRQGDILYVGILDSEDRKKRNSVLTKVILSTKLKPRVVTLSKEQFQEMLEFIRVEFFPDQKVPEQILSEEIVPEQKVEPPQKSHTPEPVKPPAPKKRLGEQLIDEGLITEEQLDVALQESKQTGTPIGSVLVKLGFINLEQLRQTLSKQQGIAHVETKDLRVESNVIRLLPEDFIKDNKAVPIRTDGKTIVVGMVNPNNKRALNDIIFLTGLQPLPLILTHIEYEKCINNFFETKRETERLMDEISQEEDAKISDDNLWGHLEKELEDESNIVAKFASSIVTDAIEKKASDIHIEPRNGKYIVRYRIDGILKQVLEIPNKIEGILMSRLKVISRMNIAEHRRAQDGHFSLKHNGRVYDLRVNTLPIAEREKMVIRILQPEIKFSKEDRIIDLVGSTRNDIQKINLMTTLPHGVILATGPTGSGKTTTLYSIINKINNESVNITTIEDPVEVKLEGINQVQVNPKADITFASSLRSILRQDPDIIMVGEIRDKETLEAAINAALTGHLVLSTLHTNSATATITRMVEMGAAPYLLSTTIVGIIAQRLVRKLCPHCRQLYNPTIDELKMILSQTEDFEAFTGNRIYTTGGCGQCDYSGYIGRMGLYEIMMINREIRKMIIQSNAAHEIEDVAISCGMKTLQRAGLEAILGGQTTIAEYIRVLGAVSE